MSSVLVANRALVLMYIYAHIACAYEAAISLPPPHLPRVEVVHLVTD
jgi:hypothetical protein